MKNLILAFVISIQLSSLFAQETVLVAAKNGLNIRLSANLKSEKIGKFDFAEKIEILKKTGDYIEVIDNKKKVKGEWYKVKGKSSTNSIVIGYVFSGFLTKPKQKDTFKFMNYNDDFDYFLLNAQKEKSLYQFINNNEDRSYARGDSIEIEWKEDLTYSAGDGESKHIAAYIITTKKNKTELFPILERNTNIK